MLAAGLMHKRAVLGSCRKASQSIEMVFAFFCFGAVQINSRGPGAWMAGLLYFSIWGVEGCAVERSELRARGVMSEARGKIR